MTWDEWVALRLAVYWRDRFACQHCRLIFGYPEGYDGGRPLAVRALNRFGQPTTYYLELDHVVPRCRGGPTTLANLQALCTGCNGRKGRVSDRRPGLRRAYA